MFIVVAALLQILLASAALAADFSGLVVSVLDSDTLEVLYNRHPERIRLNGRKYRAHVSIRSTSETRFRNWFMEDRYESMDSPRRDSG